MPLDYIQGLIELAKKNSLAFIEVGSIRIVMPRGKTTQPEMPRKEGQQKPAAKTKREAEDMALFGEVVEDINIFGVK